MSGPGPGAAADSAIRAVIDAWAAAFDAGRHDELAAFWAPDVDPIYVAEEQQPLIGREALHAYWQALGGARVLSRISGFTTRALAPGVALAFYHLHWSLAFSEPGYWDGPIGGHVRVSVVLKDTPEGWKICHYTEAPLAAALQMKQWLEANVHPDF